MIIIAPSTKCVANNMLWAQSFDLMHLNVPKEHFKDIFIHLKIRGHFCSKFTNDVKPNKRKLS